MQIRRSSFPLEASVPPCPFEHEQSGPCLHRHGSYDRQSIVQNRLVPIQRFLCKFVGKTLSVLHDGFLPYRLVDVARLTADFDHRADPDTFVAKDHGPILNHCLKRAWKRFALSERATSLMDFFGQRLPLTDTPEALWKALRENIGSLSTILLELARDGRSLLADYRCLSP